MKKKLFYLIPPLIVLVFMSIYYYLSGIFPFGQKVIAWCDMEQQVIPILMQFKDVLSGKSSILYSSANAGGMNFWGVFLFFISSPFSFAVALVEKADVMNLMNILVPLKLAVCALTASIFFKFEIKNLNFSFNIILSVMYAFCGFGLMYYQNHVWLDIMYLFPLLMIGLKKMLRDGKPILYIITLTCYVAINFYMTYMAALFIIIETFLYIKYCVEDTHKTKSILMFCFSTLISILASAVFWLPAFMQFLGSGRGVNIIDSLGMGYLYTHIAVKVELLLSSAILFVCIPLFASKKFRKHIDTRTKQLGITLLLLTIPVFIEPINKLWHTGSYQCFPVRYGYMLVLIGLAIIGRFLSNVKTPKYLNKKFFIITTGIVSAAFFCSVIFGYDIITDKMNAYVSSLWTDVEQFFYHLIFAAIAFAAYAICILFYRSGYLGKHFTVFILSVLCITEMTLNTTVFLGNASSDDELFEQSMQLEDSINDDSFYRVKTDKKYLHANMIGALGYNTLAHYTSLTSGDYIYTMKKLGYSSYWMEVCSNGGTRITDAVLSNKYSLGPKNFYMQYGDEVYSDNLFNVYKNDLWLPVAILTDTNPYDMQTLDLSDRVSVQKEFADELLGNSDMVTTYEPSSLSGIQYSHSDDRYDVTLSEDSKIHKIEYDFYVDGMQEVYIDLFDNLSTNVRESYYDSIKIAVNDVLVEDSYPTQLNNGLFKLGTFTNRKISVTITVLKDFNVRSFGIFGVNLDSLNQSLENVQSADVISDQNNFYFTCSASDNQYLYISIPYDSGFTAYNNGEITEIYQVNDCFMAVKLNSGQNNIQLTYYPSGFKSGIILSCLGALALSLYLIFFRKKFTAVKQNPIILKCSYILFYAFISIIYILPVLISLAYLPYNLRIDGIL